MMNPIPRWADEYNDGAHLGQPITWFMGSEIAALRSRLALYEEVNKHLNFANAKLEELMSIQGFAFEAKCESLDAANVEIARLNRMLKDIEREMLDAELLTSRTDGLHRREE
jgi:hypothetical protein